MPTTRHDTSKGFEKARDSDLEEKSRNGSQSSQSSSAVDTHAQPELLSSENHFPRHENKESTNRKRSGTLASKLSTARDSVKAIYGRFTGSGEAEDKMGWKSTTCLMIAETISLGILSLPNAVSNLGLVPGFVLIIGAGLITTHTGKILQSMYMRHPNNTPDYPTAVGFIWGSWGRWTAEVLLWIFTFLMAGHIVLFRNMWNTESGGLTNTCTLVNTAIGAIVMGLLTIPRAFKAASRLSILSSCSIVIATFAVLVDLAIKDRGGSAHWLATTSLNNGFQRYSQVFLAVSNIVVSYTGHCCYFNIMSEMEEPKDFPKALYWTNGVTISMYTIAGVAIYALAGVDVKSPALSSATQKGQQIAYGLAIPTIVVAGVILGLVAAKRIYALNARYFTSLENENTSKSTWAWDFFVLIQWVFAYIIANGVPFFGSLLGLLGGLCGVPICLVWPAAFWFFDLRRAYEGPGWWRNMYDFLIGLMLSVGIVIMGLGLYGSISEIQYLMMQGGTEGWKQFSCAAPPAIA